MWSRAAGAFLLMMFCAGSGAVDDPAPHPLDLLVRMSSAVRTANYDGVFVYTHAHQSDTLRIIHRGAPAPMRERVISLTGLPREVLRDDRTVTTFYPDTSTVMVEKTGPRNYVVRLPGPAESILDTYTLALQDADRIAGREAWIVAVLPRDNWRYGYRIWVDQDSHLPLRTELRGLAGAPIEEIMFTQINVLSEVPSQDLEPGISGQGMTWFHGAADEAARTADGSGWRAAWVPPGFILSSREQRALVASGDPVEQLVYSDGMASVSVFIEKVHEQTPRIGPGRVGAISTFSRLTAGYQVTAVGEVPMGTVQRIANSMIQE